MRVSTQDTNTQDQSSLADTQSKFRFIKWGLFGLVIVFVAASIMLPLVYRSIHPQYRESIKRYLPIMAVLDPQRSYAADNLPTVEVPNNDNDQANAALLLTPQVLVQVPESTATPAQQVIIVTATPDAIPTDTAPPPTPLPTVASTITPMPTSTDVPPPTAVALLPSASRNNNFQHIYQGWNNCGPATITMALTYYGWSEDQNFAASFLKPDAEDKNVSPWQMVRYVNENTGVRAITRMAGDLQLLRALIEAQFPVIIETGFSPEGYDWMGHYRLVIGYDDGPSEFYVYDSFLGHNNLQGLPVSYTAFDALWEDFNRTYIVVYDTARETELRAILGNNADLTTNAQNSLEASRQDITNDPQNPFAWFNMGTSYLALDMVQEAATAYDQARNVGAGLPWRMLWYQFGPYEAYYQVGRYDDVLALAQASLGTTPYVEETYYWMGMVHQAQNQMDQAVQQFNLALQHNSNFTPAADALAEITSSNTGE